MWFIYVIQHKTTSDIYIGLTSNIKRRLAEHNHRKQSSTIKKDGIWRLVYTEVYRAKKDAILRETRLKQHGRARQELMKRIKESLIT